MATQTVELLYFGDVSSKIESAHRLHREFGSRLRADGRIRTNLDRLIHLDQEVSEAMRSMGMLELCADCGSQPPVGCCSAVMANETDAMLLLINLSAGLEASSKRDDGHECRFLGSAGCSLKFKPFVCCRVARGSYPPRALARSGRGDFHLSGSSVDAARGYEPQMRTVIRGWGSGKSRSRSWNRSQVRRLRWLRRQSHLYQDRFACSIMRSRLLKLPLTPK
jgi:hypothetical protein